jgi:hypothetical protein
MTYPLAVHAILGPCVCQGCGQVVIYARQGRKRGWLHAHGQLRCGKPGRKAKAA